MSSQITSVLEAKVYLNMYFSINDELRSYSHEVTDSGVINKSHIAQLSDSEIMDVANDAKDEITAEIGYLSQSF
jgi:hypothetical protein